MSMPSAPARAGGMFDALSGHFPCKSPRGPKNAPAPGVLKSTLMEHAFVSERGQSCEDVRRSSSEMLMRLAGCRPDG